MRAKYSGESSNSETVPLNCRTEWEEEKGGKMRAYIVQYSVEPSTLKLSLQLQYRVGGGGGREGEGAIQCGAEHF